MTVHQGWEWHRMPRVRWSQYRLVHWIVFHGKLEKTVKDETSAPRSSAVEPEYELVQLRLVDRHLVDTEQPPFRQRGDPMYPWQQPMWVAVRQVGGAAPGATRKFSIPV